MSVFPLASLSIRAQDRDPACPYWGISAKDRGASALGLLVSLLIMGALAVTVLVSLPSSRSGNDGVVKPSPNSVETANSSAAMTNAVSNVGADIHAAAVVTCQTDYQAVEAAVGYYQAEHGSLPPSLGSLAVWLRDPVTSPYFSIAIDPHHAGVVEAGTKDHALAPGEQNCQFAGQDGAG